jgi:hypothetical protein
MHNRESSLHNCLRYIFFCLTAVLALASCADKKSDAVAPSPVAETDQLGAQAAVLKAESLPDGVNMQPVKIEENEARRNLIAFGSEASEKSSYSGSFQLTGTGEMNGKHIVVALGDIKIDLDFPEKPPLALPIRVSLFDARPTLALSGGASLTAAMHCSSASCGALIGGKSKPSPGSPSQSASASYKNLCSDKNPARNNPVCVDYCNKCSNSQRDNDILNGVTQLINSAGDGVSQLTNSSIVSRGTCATVLTFGAAGVTQDTDNTEGSSSPSNPGMTPTEDQISKGTQWLCTALGCLSPGPNLADGYVYALNAACTGGAFAASAITCVPGLSQKAGIGKDLGTACSELSDAALPINPDECPINTSVMACDQNGNPRTSSWATECRAVVDKAMNVNSIVNLSTATANCIASCVKNTKAAADLCGRPSPSPPPPGPSTGGCCSYWNCFYDSAGIPGAYFHPGILSTRSVPVKSDCNTSVGPFNCNGGPTESGMVWFTWSPEACPNL